MSEHHSSGAILEAILLKSSRPLDPASEEQPVVIPSWLSDGLQKIFSEIEGEPLPKEFVILFRHLNEADHP